MRPALRAVILLGAWYFIVGVTFGAHAWRLAAWVVSAVAFGAQIWYELFRLRNSPRTTALHAAAAVALGAFGLAAAANVHELGAAAAYRPRLLVALVAWPILTGLPAFIAAWAAAAGLSFMRRSE